MTDHFAWISFTIYDLDTRPQGSGFFTCTISVSSQTKPADILAGLMKDAIDWTAEQEPHLQFTIGVISWGHEPTPIS